MTRSPGVLAARTTVTQRTRSGARLSRAPRALAGDTSPTFETWDRICKLYGLPQTFADSWRLCVEVVRDARAFDASTGMDLRSLPGVD
jgi:hypothetical protein